MLIIGIVLFAAAIVAIEVATVGSVNVDVDAFGRTYATSTGVIFVAGVLAALVACLAMLVIADSLRRRRLARVERKQLAAERDQLVVEAERARAERVAATAERERAMVDQPELDIRERVTSNGPGSSRSAAR
jgi:hypothetical protein